jgi:hypothetical protein
LKKPLDLAGGVSLPMLSYKKDLLKLDLITNRKMLSLRINISLSKILTK